MIGLRKKIGQLLIMGFEGTEINEQSPIAQWLLNDGLGGVLVFDKDLHTGHYGKNLINKNQIKKLLQQLNHYSEQGTLANTLLTAIDYEGGAVDRLASIVDCPRTSKAVELTLLPPELLKEKINTMALTLKSLGFNLNFAPVVDLSLNEEEGIIGKLGRSFSHNPEEVVRLARIFVEIFNGHGIACSYKHFPGHGSAVGDTHEGFVDVTESFQSTELVPYSQLLKEQDKPVMIMTAHVINRHLDSEGLPATLSYKILNDLLRKTLNYDGVIISDDLQMQAIAEHYSMEDALQLTFNAGADMVIFGNQLGSTTAPEVIDCIEQLVHNQQISMERIDEAYHRVRRLKQQIANTELVLN
ncbi:glycoside hydrolase family 3 N-terminal domain-containing protein [Legionella sp. km772]|uniref:glycoside hydrolase family 3 N-terminal domain-containing protein n=1 Tax=Legionella sp. km772 TaxID=2498111 RepID=UPI000F8DFDD7|nr:glycoside hydrolase family 3 N-terminal domain-containing protein [Legionella sp. km772]RUR13304.1 glycoside hydrolase family 3 protein [Legionella sp. km772]